MKHKSPEPRSRMQGLRFELLPHLVEVDLLLAEPERLSFSERDQFHAECGGVEGDGCVDAGYGENKMVEMIDGKSHINTLIGQDRKPQVSPTPSSVPEGRLNLAQDASPGVGSW